MDFIARPVRRPGKTKVRSRAVVGVVLLTALVLWGTGAGAHHRNPALGFSANPVNVGTEVTVTFSATDNDGALKSATLEACRDGDDPLPAAACDDAEPAGFWVFVAGTSGPLHNPVGYPYTPAVPGLHGFRAWSGDSGFGGNPPEPHFTVDDLEVNAVNSGQRHNGCNGIENAITKVSDNGKGKQKLEEIADRFNCDV